MYADTSGEPSANPDTVRRNYGYEEETRQESKYKGS